MKLVFCMVVKIKFDAKINFILFRLSLFRLSATFELETSAQN